MTRVQLSARRPAFAISAMVALFPGGVASVTISLRPHHDVPISRENRRAVVGHMSAINVLRAHGIPSDKLLTVRGGEDYEFSKFSLSLKVIPNLHSPLNQKLYFDDRISLNSCCRGGSSRLLAVCFGDLAFGSMNYIERE